MFKSGQLIILTKAEDNAARAIVKYDGIGYNPLQEDGHFLYVGIPVMFVGFITSQFQEQQTNKVVKKIIFLSNDSLWATRGWMTEQQIIRAFGLCQICSNRGS